METKAHGGEHGQGLGWQGGKAGGRRVPRCAAPTRVARAGSAQPKPACSRDPADITVVIFPQA